MKKHKGLFICLGVLIILIILAIIGVKSLLYPDSSVDKYGDRLNGIENYSISDSSIQNIKNEFLEDSNVNKIDYILTGKIIKIIVEVKKDTKVEDAKNLSEIILKNLTDEQKSFYDIAYTITCEEQSDLYPIIGSKNKSSSTFSWTIKIIKEKGEEDEE